MPMTKADMTHAKMKALCAEGFKVGMLFTFAGETQKILSIAISELRTLRLNGKLDAVRIGGRWGYYTAQLYDMREAKKHAALHKE